MMTRFMAIIAMMLVAGGAWAQEPLASLPAGQSAEGGWTAEAAFATAEYLWNATVRIDGPGTLTLCYSGDGRTALRTIEGPTEEPQPISLQMRANPGTGALTMPVEWTFAAGDAQARCWVIAADGTPIGDGATLQLAPLYQHAIPRVTEPPVIDGDLSDACWDDAAYIGDPYWRMYNEPRDAKMATHVWCAYDDENLYVAFRCETPDVGRLVARIADRDGFVWRDDSAEIFFDWGHDHHTYYEYNINPKGVVFDAKYFDEGGAWLTDWDYIGEWKTSTEPGAWIAEIRLALESFERRDLRGNPTGEMPLPAGDIAGILFSRNDRVVGEGMSHADNAPSFHEVDQYGHLVGFRPNRPEAYRKTALREIERLERRWATLDAAAGSPGTIAPRHSRATGTVGLPEAIAAVREQAEASAPAFEDWVATNTRIEELDAWLNRARALLAPQIAARRWPDTPWGLAIAAPEEPDAGPLVSATLQVPPVIELSGARGEWIPVHLVGLPREGASRDVGVQVTGLSGAGGTLDQIRWYSIESNGRLVPERPETTVNLANLWWEIGIPRDARPGVYRGQIVTTDGEHRVALPVELTVHDFTLPTTPSLAISAGLDAQHIAQQWYGERSPLGAGEYWPYAEALLQHGVVPREMLADFTSWSDSGMDFAGANRMLARARPYKPDTRAMIAARAEQLSALDDPRTALARAVDHWRDVTNRQPIHAHVDHGAPVPAIGRRQHRNSVAVAWSRADLSDIADIGTWAMPPLAAGGLGECRGARVRTAADQAGSAKRWGISHGPDHPEVRMLGWLADDARTDLIFWEPLDYEALCASRLLWCKGLNGEPLAQPHPTVMLKLLREALEDYEYLRIARELYRESGVLQSPERLSRLRMALYGRYQRNWDMVMNVRDYNRDPEYLAERRASVATDIVRTRAMLRRARPDARLPGDAEG